MKTFILQIFFTFLVLTHFLFTLTKADDSLKFPLLKREIKTVSESNKISAEKLYQQALTEIDANNCQKAMQLIINALKLNPNHKEIREIFGYYLHDNEWRTNWEIKKLKDYTEHPQFGWIKTDYIKRYEKGERMINSQRWSSAAEEINFRTNIQNGWKIITPHYEIITNHSLEEGVTWSRELEQLHDVWQLFIYSSLNDNLRIKSLFQKKATIFLPLQRKVTIYRNKNDYIADLIKIEPNIANTNGYYLPKQKRAYFYAVSPKSKKSINSDNSNNSDNSDNSDESDESEESVRRALYHEGSHQLFYEPRSTSRPNEPPGSRCNGWLVEGLAMFMETLRTDDNYYILGNILDTRLYAAKYNEQELNFYAPFGQLVKMGMNDLQRQKELSKIYSQSSAMTHFLMFAENGKYRDALLKLIKAIHNGTDKPESLAKFTNCTYEELDKKYKEFLKTIPDSIE